MTRRPDASIRNADLVFWDFDGVIKESVDVKTRAFERLFAEYGPDVQARVRAHHEANGGMTRSEKIPVYLQFAGQTPTPERVEELSVRFGDLVRDAVIDSAWVPGAEDYIRRNPNGQRFVVVSATPQQELEYILAALNVAEAFDAVFGAPTSKRDAIGTTLARTGTPPDRAVMIGDAGADLDAAFAHGVPAALRAHDSNGELVRRYPDLVINDLSDL